MPTVTFGNVKSAEVATESSTAVVPVSSGAVSPAAEPHNAAPQLVGDWGGASSAPPSLLLSQKTSKYVEDEGPLQGKFGLWVYDKSTILGPPSDAKAYSPELDRALKKDSVLVIVCHAAVLFEEDVPFGEGIIPDRWRSSAEARASGKKYIDVGILDMLLAYEDEHEQLLVLDGKGFLKVRFYAKNAAFRQVAARVKDDAKTWLKGDLASGFYELTVTKMSGAKSAYWVAGAKSAGKVPASLREAIKTEFPSV